jgi:hypothetical protein
MKKQEVLDYLGIAELPEPAATSNKKCAALVRRTTGQEDYVVCQNGGIVLDRNFKAGITKIIEFYPEVKPEPEKVEHEHEHEQEPEPEKPAPKKKVVRKRPANFNRKDVIESLEKQGLNKDWSKKSDKELKELMKSIQI